jgi:phenylpropionate dioxygenase-like ring-hydroxylating dioxygenase large terminal subunit
MSLSITPPLAEEFPAHPRSWYYVCSSEDLKKGPIKRQLFGRELAVFRTEDGRAAVLENRCSHMGASLAGGCVDGALLRCPYHGWGYDADGRCRDVGKGVEVPTFAKQDSYPVVERYGHVFAFNGPRALFDLPFFLGESDRDYVPGPTFEFSAETPWYLLGAHAFDARHLEQVHERQLKAPLKVETPSFHSRRASHDSTIVGNNVFDRFLKVFAGRDVSISMTVHGGVFILVTGDFRSVRSRFFLMAEPLENGRVKVKGLVFLRKGRFPAVDAAVNVIRGPLRRLFTAGYLLEEVGNLQSHVYRPDRLTPQDAEVIRYLRWMADTQKAAERELFPTAAPLPAPAVAPAETATLAGR